MRFRLARYGVFIACLLLGTSAGWAARKVSPRSRALSAARTKLGRRATVGRKPLLTQRPTGNDPSRHWLFPVRVNGKTVADKAVLVSVQPEVTRHGRPVKDPRRGLRRTVGTRTRQRTTARLVDVARFDQAPNRMSLDWNDVDLGRIVTSGIAVIVPRYSAEDATTTIGERFVKTVGGVFHGEAGDAAAVIALRPADRSRKARGTKGVMRFWDQVDRKNFLFTFD